MTLIDDTTIELQAQVDETQIAQVALGQTAVVMLGAFPNQTFSGTVTAISPEATFESNIPIFDVVIELENADLTLRPGMTAEAEIVVQQVNNAVTLPLAALQISVAQGRTAPENGARDTEAAARPQTSEGTQESVGQRGMGQGGRTPKLEMDVVKGQPLVAEKKRDKPTRAVA